MLLINMVIRIKDINKKGNTLKLVKILPEPEKNPIDQKQKPHIHTIHPKN